MKMAKNYENRIKILNAISKSKAYKIEGQKFNYLTAIKKVESKNNQTLWSFKCDCGKIIETRPGLIVRGKQRSCGCRSRVITEEKYAGR